MNQNQRSSDGQEFAKWQEVKTMMGKENIVFGPYFSYQLRNTPRRILFMLSRYKFAAKMFGANKKILEIGCNEGIGTVLLSEFASQVIGIDIDVEAVSWAQRNFANEKTSFIVGDFMSKMVEPSGFDGIVSFDVIEHIFPDNEALFFEKMWLQLKDDGICIIGTPNLDADMYASPLTKQGHVNMYDWQKINKKMNEYFQQCFLFSSNDEMVHTGFYPLAHYLIAVGVGRKVL